MPSAACCSETSFSGGTTGMFAGCWTEAEGVLWLASDLGGLSCEVVTGQRAQRVSGSEGIIIAPPGAAAWWGGDRERSRRSRRLRWCR
jgi:hypothetical protein